MQQIEKSALVQREKRYDVKVAVKARLYLAPQGENLVVKIANISKSGLSIRSQDVVPPESDVFLILNGQHVRLNLVWELPAPNGRMAYGFKCVRKNADLVRMFVGAGLAISQTKEKLQSDEESFIEEFSTIEFEAFPSAS